MEKKEKSLLTEICQNKKMLFMFAVNKINFCILRKTEELVAL